MNELVRQLAEQAHAAALAAYRQRMTTESAEDVIFAHMYDQQFALLIVQECLAVCDAYGQPDGTSPVAEILATVIKSKFGVKK